MKYYESSALINASAQAVWDLITDAAGLPSWDSGIERVEGRIAAGETIKVHVHANPGRAFPVKVSEWAPPQRMVWSGGMPLGLFKGVRSYVLTSDSGSIRFTMREEYTGLLLPLIWRSIPDLQPFFDQYARGLKARAESAH